MNTRPHTFRILLIFALLIFPSFASAQIDLLDAIRDGTPLIDLRLRYENVDQENKPRNAAATTFRERLGYQTGQYFGSPSRSSISFSIWAPNTSSIRSRVGRQLSIRQFQIPTWSR